MSTPVEISEEAGVRFLHFGSEWIQGAMRLRKPDSLELEYTREMMMGLLLRDAPWPRSALLIGLGAGSLTKFIYRNLPATRTTVVEIEPKVHAVAQQFFKLPPEDERLNIVIGDGVTYMNAGKKRFDGILVDGFDENARPGALDSEPFYAACRSRLTTKGILAVNLFGQRRGYKASVGRLERAFDGRVIILPPGESGNVIGFALGDEVLSTDLTELRLRAERLKTDTGLDLKPTIARLQLTQSLPGGRLSV